MIALVALLVVVLLGSEGLSSAASNSRMAEQVPVAPVAAEPASPPPKAGVPATVIDDQEVDGVLGKSVRGSGGEDMGRIVDILVNRTGQVRAAIIDFGGFLGVGSRKIAVDWKALHFPESGKFDRITVDLTRNQVRLAPEYKPGEPIVVLGPSDSTAPPDNSSPRSEK
jgi:hypothetical protein